MFAPRLDDGGADDLHDVGGMGEVRAGLAKRLQEPVEKDLRLPLFVAVTFVWTHDTNLESVSLFGMAPFLPEDSAVVSSTKRQVGFVDAGQLAGGGAGVRYWHESNRDIDGGTPGD